MLDSVPRPPASRPRRPPRLRLLLPLPARTVRLGSLLLVLAVGCGIALRLGPGSASESGATATPGPRRSVATPRPSTTVPAVRPFTAAVGGTTGCQSLAAAAPQLLCPIPSGTVTYTQVTDVAARYRAIADPDDGVAERGPAACARGRADERAWSRPDAPARVAGRYRCRVVATRAEMWWTVTDAGVLADATRDDGDLSALFSWWRSRTAG